MNKILRQEAEAIVRAAIESVSPANAVARALNGVTFPGRLYLVSVGKAAWKMADAALSILEQPVADGIVVTKYRHVEHPLPGIRCFEAGHPVPDENSFAATQAVLDMTRDLTKIDTVLFLLSGGGSALFELPLIPVQELQEITAQLLACGADITEMNTIRKRLSSVKGGQFAQHCAPAMVQAIVLSDILGDPLDQIASGPAAADSTTCADAMAIARKYNLQLSSAACDCFKRETPKQLTNVTSTIIGSVQQLCRAAEQICRRRGYKTVLLTDRLNCEASQAGNFLASILQTQAAEHPDEKLAFLAGGETIVHVKGSGLGGRNQELALAAAKGIAGLPNAAIISVGSDGTDGPTDAAGGYVDGDTFAALYEQGLDYDTMLINNDAYHALQAVGGLLITGPTGTNVNDISIALLN